MTPTPSHNIDFDELANSLLPLGALNSPSELQGLLCGKLCGGLPLTEVEWLLEAVEFLDFTQAPDLTIRDLLSRLFNATCEQLRGDGLYLVLPDDDREMAERLTALSQWCHGFLTGFGSAGAKEAMSDDARDMLQDLAALVQVETDEEDSEADYMEVTEYVRIVAVSLYDEFASVAEDPMAANQSVASRLH